MPTKIQGFEVLTKPKDTSIESFPIFITIPANTTRIVTFPTEFNAVAIALQIENQDAANAASYRINSSTNPMINLPASNFRSFADMNIVSVTVTTGAAGVCIISGQMAALPKPIMGEVL
ncbi:MAG: hypothetical protein HOK72_02430 [Flavobacteriales bacterium]|jgi:hypothetical protein|nr:hypothetical protein [Flavobacteriales bacterium]